jgi:hypothetical protein
MPPASIPAETEQTPLRVLIIEDSQDDTILMLRALKQGGYHCHHRRVQAVDELRSALDEEWDVILADWNIPRFDPMEALALIREGGRDIPFIIVSGTIGEETAVAAMKAGASDYVRKDHLPRLVAAVNRELLESRERRRRREAVQALHTQFQQIVTIFDSLHALVYVSDPEDRSLLFINRSGDREMIGSPCYRILHGLDAPCPSCPDGEVILAGEEASPQVREYRDEATGAWYQCINRAIRWPDGRLVHLAISVDISERKVMEQQQAEMLSFVSHEMRTPLTAIMGYSDFLLNEEVPLEQQQRCMATILQETERLSKLIDDFLTVQRAQTRRQG